MEREQEAKGKDCTEEHRLFELADKLDKIINKFMAENEVSHKDMAEGLITWIDYKFGAKGSFYNPWTEDLEQWTDDGTGIDYAKEVC